MKTTKVTIYLDADQAQILRDWFDAMRRLDAFMTPGQFAMQFLPKALVKGAVQEMAETPWPLVEPKEAPRG